MLDEVYEDTKKKLVKRTLKINMDVIKYEKLNATTSPLLFPNFRKFGKIRTSEKSKI